MAGAVIRKLRSHPCLVLWCGGNEMQYYGEKPDSPLLRQYGELTAQLCPDVEYHVSSPDRSRPGERHHGPWHFLSHAEYNDHIRCFASEIGCNGMPEYESICHFIPTGEPCPQGQSWKYHFLLSDGYKSLLAPLETIPWKTKEDLCQASQFAQADALGYIMEHYRRMWPAASGCLLWQYNESWPTCAWSMVDWYSRPRAAYYRLKKSCAPVMLSLRDENRQIDNRVFRAELWSVNAMPVLSGATVELTLTTVDNRIIMKDSFPTDLPEGALKLHDYQHKLPDDITADLLFVFMKISRDGRTLFATERLYGLGGFHNIFSLPATGLAVNAVWNNTARLLAVLITNTGSRTAVALRADLSGFPVKNAYWSDNYFCLRPGENREITAVITGSDIPESVAVRSWNTNTASCKPQTQR